MKDEFNENFSEFSKLEDLQFIRSMLLQQACELHDAYSYIYDTHRQFQTDELQTVLEYVRLCKVGLERAFDDLDNLLLDRSECADYHWSYNGKQEK